MISQCQYEILMCVHEHLRDTDFNPHWRNRYADQCWISLKWDCPRRSADLINSSQLPNIEISLLDNLLLLHITHMFSNIYGDKWFRITSIDVADPELFEKLELSICNAEQTLQLCIVNKHVDEALFISAFGPRPL